MESSPLNHLPQDTLHHIFCRLRLRQIAAAKCVCKALRAALSSPSFLHLLRLDAEPRHQFPLIALKPSHRHESPHANLQAYDPASNQWLRFSLSPLPFPALHPISSSHGCLYLWASTNPQNTPEQNSQKALVVCNPLTGQFKTLPQLGSAWSRHGSVLAGSDGVVLVLTKLAILYYSVNNGDAQSNNNNWRKFLSNLPSKPRSPVMISDSILAMCDLGAPWRSRWAIFTTKVKITEKKTTIMWTRLEKQEWGDIFVILKRPRLARTANDRSLYVVGGLRSSDTMPSACATIMIMRLDLESLGWDEVGRMPLDMYKFFMGCGKYKVFGGGNRVCFSAKRVRRLACGKGMGWRNGGGWRACRVAEMGFVVGLCSTRGLMVWCR